VLYRAPSSEATARRPFLLRARGPEAVALLLFAVFVLRPAFRERPRAHGDSGEYFLTAESLLSHGSPALHGDDLVSLGEAAQKHRIEGTFGRLLSLYLPSRDGRVYGIHFWAYPLVTLPAKAALRLLGENEMKAPQITNALLLLAALVHVLFFSTLSMVARRVFAAGLVLSPLLPFVLWPHPEVFSCTLVASALVFRHERRPVAAVLCAALASAQNSPLVLLAAWLLGSAWRGASSWERLRLVLAFLPALVPVVMALLTFGTPSLLLRAGAADPVHLSVRRTLELFLDPDLGLLPYAPLTLGLAAAAMVLLRTPELLEDGVLLLAMAFACTAVANWNHGTSGPSRYAVWLFPLVIDMVARAASVSSAAWRAAALSAIAVQAAIAMGRGGPHAPDDHLRHGVVARFLLARWPAAYDPDPEVFAERSRNAERPLDEPAIFRADGACRKALVQKRHLPELRAECGEPRSAPDFRALVAREGRDAWAYVNY